MTDLKLIALDADDLTVLSLHLQDAVVRVADMAFLKGEKRFAAVVNRFDWEQAERPNVKARERNVRRRAGLRFERVLGAEVQGLDLAKADAVLSLLSVTFAPGEAPSGNVMMHFSGGSAIRLNVECIEAELKDLGAAWAAKRKPEHGAS